MDKIKTFSDVKIGDTIYKVDLLGNITTHKIIDISLIGYMWQFCYDVTNTDCFLTFLIRREDIYLYGSGGIYTTYEKAKKLAISRKKHYIKRRLEIYTSKKEELDQKIKDLELDLIDLELDI